MQKLLWALLFISCGLTCKKGLTQPDTTRDTLAIQRMLSDLDKLTVKDLNASILLSKEIQKKAVKIKYQTAIWEARIYEGKAYHSLGFPDSSQVILNQVLKETQEQKSRLSEAKAHVALAIAFQKQYNFLSAIDHLIQAEKLIKDSDPFELRFDVLNQRAITHRKMKDYTSALKYLDMLENSFLSQMDAHRRYILFQNKGNVYADLQKYDRTEEFFNKAYQEISQIDSPSNLALITYNLGALYYRQKRFTEAEKYIKKSLQIESKIGNKTNIERSYRVLGSIYLDQKKYPEAKKFFEMAMAIARQTNNPQAIKGNYNNLYLTYWNMGYYNNNIKEMDKALKYYMRYTQIKDSLYKTETTAKVLELEKQYDTEKKNTQIAVLEKENQHKEDQLLVQHTQRNYLILVIILVSGILIIFVYFFYYYKKVNKILQQQSKSILEQTNQISEQNTKLQKSLNTQNKLFSIIAHDLRSPLASIINISNLIGFYIQDKEYEALEGTVKMMDQKTYQILDLTDNLLSWAKSQTEGLHPMFVPLSMSEVLEECLELYRPIAEEKNITISSFSQKDLRIWADRNMIKTICRNLVNNAVKFTHRDGQINIWYERRDQFARISVKDSGIGIDQAKLGSLFEIGHEKITPGTAGEKSSGLGLSVCNEFVLAMNGRIWAESEVGVGSLFVVELLMYDPQVHVSKYKQVQKPQIPSLLSN